MRPACTLRVTQKAIISYRIGKRDGANTDDFVQDLRGRVLGAPEISTDGYGPYKLSVRDAFRNSAHGVIVKTVSVVDLRQAAAHRYSPAELVAVAREAIQGVPAEISTSYVERSNLTLRMESRRFTRLTNGFSKKWENLKAAYALHFAHYNFCRVHSSIRCTPAMEAGITKSVWTLKDLLTA